jgi:hypothetical protein
VCSAFGDLLSAVDDSLDEPREVTYFNTLTAETSASNHRQGLYAQNAAADPAHVSLNAQCAIAAKRNDR